MDGSQNPRKHTQTQRNAEDNDFTVLKPISGFHISLAGEDSHSLPPWASVITFTPLPSLTRLQARWSQVTPMAGVDNSLHYQIPRL